MTFLVLAMQVFLPIALIAWVAYLPAGSLAGFLMKVAGTGASLFALAKVAQWAVPIWWLPWVFGGLWLAAVVMAARPARGLPLSPSSGAGWLGAVLAAVLLGLGGWYGAQAVAGRRPPPGEIVEIANPFGPGRYLVGNGGSIQLVNGHLRTLDASVERYRPWRGQSYGLDFFGLGPWGLRAVGWRPAAPSAYAIFGRELLAPCAGTVSAAEGSMPDFEVPRSDLVNRLGNHVILRCADAKIVLAHMRQESVVVAPGDTVIVGERLGQVGNSGATTEPHLHIHAQRPPQEGTPAISGAPLALRIGGRFLVRGDHLRGIDR